MLMLCFWYHLEIIGTLYPEHGMHAGMETTATFRIHADNTDFLLLWNRTAKDMP